MLIKEKGVGFLSGSCSSKSLKFIDFFKILGGVPVLSLPIENFKDWIVSARLIEGLSPTLPADFVFAPILISPLRKVPVVKTRDLQNISKPPSRTTEVIVFFLIFAHQLR